MARITSLDSIKKLSKKMPSGCIHFTGPICKRSGYGRIGFRGSAVNAHRVMWILTFGAIPKGLYVCHTCDNPRCINIDHLWLGTPKQNTHDMIKKGRHVHRGGRSKREYPLTHCINGHLYRPETTCITAKNIRVCLICRGIQYYADKLIISELGYENRLKTKQP